ncbi:unnamed protein product [Pleuronectes platessa]|uniref:Uncharacterized protein n=1 Tax=Pleuronectes platessa TaxID=8262 RepID=A0A9N7YQ81_PLEPL|nr:unnamed protein product [Pleuronectes platessa]
MFIFVVKPLGTCRGWGSSRSVALLSAPPEAQCAAPGGPHPVAPHGAGAEGGPLEGTGLRWVFSGDYSFLPHAKDLQIGVRLLVAVNGCVLALCWALTSPPGGIPPYIKCQPAFAPTSPEIG